MVNLLKELRDWCESAWRRRGTASALLIFALALDTVVLPTLVKVVKGVLGANGVLASATDYHVFTLWVAVGAGIANVVLVLVWLWFRRLPRFTEGTVGVLFVADPQPGTEGLVVQLYKELRRDLQSRNVRIATVDLAPSGVSVTNEAGAGALLERTGARLVIYGAVTAGKVGGEEIRGFQRISFTILVPKQDAHRTPVLGAHLGEAIAGRKFALTEKNSFIEATTVANNISEVTRFFVAVALTLGGEWQEAQPILATLMQDIAAPVAPYPLFHRFRANVAECYMEALSQELWHLYNNEIVDRITDERADAAVHRSLVLLDELRKVTPRPEQFLLSEAIMHFHRGDMARAKALVAEARKALPMAESAPHLSAAFLAIWERDFALAVDQYRRAERCSLADPMMIMGVIRFLSGLADVHPDRPELRFAVAFISDAFMDRELGIAEFQRFLAETQDDKDPGIKRLRQNAEIRIKRRQRGSGAAS